MGIRNGLEFAVASNSPPAMFVASLEKYLSISDAC